MARSQQASLEELVVKDLDTGRHMSLAEVREKTFAFPTLCIRTSKTQADKLSTTLHPLLREWSERNAGARTPSPGVPAQAPTSPSQGLVSTSS